MTFVTEKEISEMSGTELLHFIQKEKERMEKEGTIKKQPLLAEIAEDEKPYNLPSNWTWVRHNELFDISGGSQPPKSFFKDSSQEGYIRLFQIRDYGEKPQPIYIPKEKATKRTKKGDILIARYGASLGKIFLAHDGAYNVAMAKVIKLFPESLIDNDYIFYYYNSFIFQNWVRGMTRSAQAGFNKEDMKQLLFPLPSLGVQKKIVKKIEVATELKKKIDSTSDLNKKELQKYRQAIIQEAMRGELVEQNPEEGSGHKLLASIHLARQQEVKKKQILSPIEAGELPYEIPKSWAWTKLGEVISMYGGGTPSKSNPSYWNGGIPWASVKDFKEKKFLYKTVDTITKLGLENSSARIAPEGTLLIPTRMAVGKILFTKIDTAINQDLKALQCKEGFLDTFMFYLYKTLTIPTTGTTVQGASQEEILKIVIPLPPLAEQKRIVEKLDAIMAVCDRFEEGIETTKAESEKWYRAVLQEAFQPEVE